MDTDKITPNIEQNKYLVPFDLTMAQFIYIIRKNIKLSSEQALFLFINNPMVVKFITDLLSKYPLDINKRNSHDL